MKRLVKAPHLTSGGGKSKLSSFGVMVALVGAGLCMVAPGAVMFVVIGALILGPLCFKR